MRCIIDAFSFLAEFRIITLPFSKNQSINVENNAANFESALTKPHSKGEKSFKINTDV